MPSLTYMSQQITIYWGSFILISGLLGGMINCIVFLSLKTLRRNSCAFYLTLMSIFNMGQLVASVLSRILITGFNIDLTEKSFFYCKFRTILLHFCSLMSFTCLCLATIDQFLATSSHRRWQQVSNIKMAYIQTLIWMLIWTLHEIPALMLINLVQTAIPDKFNCTNNSFIYQQYVTFIYLFGLTGILPSLINIVFGSLAYRNVRQIPYRSVPLVRRELDKQLTSMVLVQVIYSVIVVLPYITTSIVNRAINSSKNPIIAERLTFASSVTGYLYYMYFVVGEEFTNFNCRCLSFFALRVHFTFTCAFPDDFANNSSMFSHAMHSNAVNKK